MSAARPLAEGVIVRAATADDIPFLDEVYASTRTEELAAVPWTEAEKRAFLLDQARTQRQAYHDRYRGTDFGVVTQGGVRIGRLYVVELSAEIRLVDMALVPEYRGRGVGTLLLRGLVRRSEEVALPITLYVERWNRARHLYLRWGFRSDEGDRDAVYERMERTPSGEAAGDAADPTRPSADASVS
jgi:GNAT superfamily N-acetyltransferase